MLAASKEIIERPKGRIDTFFGMPPDVTIPDTLDQVIHQPEGVEIHMVGPKDDLQVTFRSPSGEFSFNDISPKTRFAVQDSPYFGFQHLARDGKHVVVLPCVKKKLNREPVLAILHEKGHAASHEDTAWLDQLREARKQLQSQSFSRKIDGFMWVSKDPSERELERQAMATVCQNERRASAYGLLQIRELRRNGIDPVPHRSVDDLMRYINHALETHTHSAFGVSAIRKRQSIPERLLDKLLRVSPRENNRAVYIPKWEDMQRQIKARFAIKSAVAMAAFGIAAPVLTGIIGSSASLPVTPEKLIVTGVFGIGGGFLYAISCIEYK